MATSLLINRRSAQSAPLGRASFVYGAIALVSALAVLPSIGKSIWTDEAVSMYSARLSWSALWQQSHVVDRVFLPYYTLLHVWLLVNGSLEWARVLSLVAYALTIFVVARLALRLAGFWGGVVAAVLCATNSLMVQGALDVRPYAFTALFAAVSVNFLIRWFDDEGQRWFWWFALAALVALAFQQFAVLAPLGALVGVAALRPRWLWNRRREIAVPLAVLLAVSLVFLLLTIDQRRQVGWIPPLRGAYLFNALNGPAAGSSFGGRFIYTLAVLAIVAVCVLILTTSRTELGRRIAPGEFEHFVIFFAWAALPTVALMAVSIVKSVYVSRYVTASAPGLALAVALLAVKAYQLRSREKRAALVVVSSLITIVLIAGALISSTYIAENVKGAAVFLARQTETSGAVAYPNPLTASEFGRYDSTHEWPLVTAPGRMFWKKDLETSRSSFSRAPSDVWVVTAENSRDFVRSLVARGYREVGEKIFAGNIAVYLAHYRR